MNSLTASGAVVVGVSIDWPRFRRKLVGHPEPRHFFLQRLATELPSLRLGPHGAVVGD